jgi:hypothetical protein
MKRVIYYLRDLVWPSVLAAGFGVATVGALMFHSIAVAQVFALLAISSAILSVRS